MNTRTSIAAISNSAVARQSAGVAPDSRQLALLGRQRRWSFRRLGKAPMPEEPVRLGDWLIVPAKDDSTAVPARTMARIQAIFAAGIQPKGFVVVHEAPRLLKTPVEPREREHSPMAETAFLPQSGSDALTTFGTAVSAMASVILPMFIFMAAAMVDPILVAVTEDNVWIEIDRWNAEEP